MSLLTFFGKLYSVLTDALEPKCQISFNHHRGDWGDACMSYSDPITKSQDIC